MRAYGLMCLCLVFAVSAVGDEKDDEIRRLKAEVKMLRKGLARSRAQVATRSITQPKSQISQVFAVSGFAYTMGDKPAVSISVGRDTTHYLDVTMLRADVRSGAVLACVKKGLGKTISASVTWGGDVYIQSSKHDTFMMVCINRVEHSRKQAHVTVCGRLVHRSKHGEYYNIVPSSFLVAGEHFANLTETPD